MNVVPYENHIPTRESTITSLDEFLRRIQGIILGGGHDFLIQRTQLEKLIKLQLTQATGNSQNFLTTGLVQLIEEMITCEKRLLGEFLRLLPFFLIGIGCNSSYFLCLLIRHIY